MMRLWYYETQGPLIKKRTSVLYISHTHTHTCTHTHTHTHTIKTTHKHHTTHIHQTTHIYTQKTIRVMDNNNNKHNNFHERHRLLHHSETDGISIDVPAFDLQEVLDKDYKPMEWTIDATEYDTGGNSFDTLREELSKYKIKLDVGNDSNPCFKEQLGYIDRPSETLQQENLRFLWSKLLHHLTFHRGEVTGEILLPPVQDIGEWHNYVVDHDPVEPVVIMKHHLPNNLQDTFILPVIISKFLLFHSLDVLSSFQNFFSSSVLAHP